MRKSIVLAAAVLLAAPVVAAAEPTKAELVEFAPLCAAYFQSEMAASASGTSDHDLAASGYDAAWGYYKVHSGKDEAAAQSDVTAAAAGLDTQIKAAGISRSEFHNLCSYMYLIVLAPQ